MSTWRPLLRIARRDARRARARSALVLVLIALPVLSVVAADVLISTADTRTDEALERTMGGADALVVAGMNRWVVQGFDPDSGPSSAGGTRKAPANAGQIERALGRPVDAVTLLRGGARVETAKGVTDAELLATDWSEPSTEGLTRLTDGRYPQSPNEVAVNQAARERGVVHDDLLVLEDGTELRVTGTVESTVTRTRPFLTAPLGGAVVGDAHAHSWLLDAGDVTWDDVVALNHLGVTVASRAVLTDPPPDSVLTGRYAGQAEGSYDDSVVLAVVALVVTMVVLEVVLLAGPAFAVGARRQARTMALMAASGGTPKQSRRLVLASAVVLGGIAAMVGVIGGVLVGIALVPVVQRLSDDWLGPIEVPWLHLAGVAAFGLVSALLAALVPAVLAARQDVVAVLAGRRGDAPPSRRAPLAGLVVVGLGVALAVAGSVRGESSGSLLIAVAALVCVLGMLLVVPLVVAVVARLARRLPLSLRFAARDAARHRTRTVPAVAAVAATVAGVVALGISTTSDATENRETYVAALPDGAARVSSYARTATADLAAAARVLAEKHPDAEVVQVRGVSEVGAAGEPYVDVDAGQGAMFDYSSMLGSGVLAMDDLTALADPLSADQVAQAEAAVAAGRAAVFVQETPKRDTVRLHAVWSDYDTGETLRERKAVWPATYVEVSGRAPALAVLPDAALRTVEVTPTVVGLYLPGPVSAETERDLEDELGAVSGDMSVYVERGYQTPDSDVIVQLVLAGLGAVLMLGGTLTATFLALADARPDLATLGAVGAAPRTRRSVAAAYALVVGLVGAVLGALVGAVPGLAIARVLTTTNGYATSGSGGFSGDEVTMTGPFIDVPWLLILTLVVGLPLLTAGVVGAVSRSRLPLVARLD